MNFMFIHSNFLNNRFESTIIVMNFVTIPSPPTHIFTIVEIRNVRNHYSEV